MHLAQARTLLPEGKRVLACAIEGLDISLLLMLDCIYLLI